MKKIFTQNEDIRLTAYLNWRIEEHSQILNVLNIADGFMQSAIVLAENSILDNQHKKADVIIFPILANANHGIELYLKGFLFTLNELLGGSGKVEGSHDLRQLLQTLQARLKDYKGSEYLKAFNDTNSGLIEYISELFSLIDRGDKKNYMDFSRYPVAKDNSNHFYVDFIGNVTVDLVNFVERFKNIHSLLEEYTDYFYHQELMQDW